MEKRTKLIIFALIALIIFSIICILIFNQVINNRGEGGEETDSKIINTVSDVEDSVEEYTIKWYAEYFIKQCNSESEDILISILDNQYIEKNKIDKSNVMSMLKKYEDSIIDVDFLQVRNLSLTVSNYYLIGTINEEEVKIIVNVDYNNKTYSITPCSDLSDAEFYSINNVESIQTNSNNKFEYKFKAF